MFCSNCGQKIEDDVKFCSSCGTNVGNTQANNQPVTSTPVVTVTAKSFRCNGCGASLKIPKNSKGHVKCPSCKTECMIDGLVKNAELAEKDNINSGIPLSASSVILHKKLLSYLSGTSNVPLDVFEKVEVIREEHYCVSAYYFYCNGNASFTYDVAEIKQQTFTRDLGDRVETVTKNHEEWKNGMSSTVSVKGHFLAPGNKKMVTQTKRLYSNFNQNKLIDYDDLEFPVDVETFGYDLPQAIAFDENIVPLVDEMLKEQANKLLAKQKTRDLSMGGSSIQKDLTRIFLGMYRIVYKYGGNEYVIWVSGDGQNAYHEGIPQDAQRKEKFAELQRAKEQGVGSIAIPKTGFLNFGKWVFIIVSVLGLLMTFISGDPIKNPIGLIFLILGLAGSISLGVIRSKKRNSYTAKRAEIEMKFQKEIDDFQDQASNVVQQFMAKKEALHGIYEGVSGDASAF